MTVRVKIGGALVAGTLMLVVGVPAAQAQLAATQVKCLATVAKAGGKFVAKKLKAIQKCRDRSLNADLTDNCPSTPLFCVGGANGGASCATDSECPGGSCKGGEPWITIANLAISLYATIDSKCSFLAPAEFGSMGFPGKCLAATPGTFTETDLKNCIYDSHETVVDKLIGVEYGTTSGELAADILKCQQTISKNGAKFVNTKLKAIQKCRNAILGQKLFGVAARNCATSDSKTQATITKAESKTRAAIDGKCTDANIQALDVCDPNAAVKLDAENCIIATHGNAVDNLNPASAANLVDYEYADQLSCGDGILNSSIDPFDFSEECDGADAPDCPGQCGAVTGVYATGSFPCLCLDKKRQRVIEHANADSDDGWTGISHDRYLVEGGGYQSDLYDCDGPSGSDTVCTVGPSCTIEDPPSSGIHARCANNGDCGSNGPCRKERTAAGPHCNLDIQQACTSNANCPGTGNFCLKTYHGPPLPLSAGGVSVCVENVFTEDVFGTVNLATGDTSMFYHQDTITHFGPIPKQPCPVCGRFCGAPPNGDRRPCTTDADCTTVPGSPRCVTDLICSGGTTTDQPCRTEFPYGATNPLFGATSLDCLPNTQIVANLDLTFPDRTTGTVTLLPHIQCEQGAFANKVCMGGTNNGRPCTSASQCDSGTCSHQCPCPGGGVVNTRPNGCDAACLGGDNDGNACAVDSECPPSGFCHLGDCRLDTSVDPSLHEGLCSAGPLESICSFNKERSCNLDADCQRPTCPFCETDPLETCVTTFLNCFENAGIIRTGIPHPVNPTTVVAECAGAANAAVSAASGLPGPSTNRYPETRINTGF